MSTHVLWRWSRKMSSWELETAVDDAGKKRRSLRLVRRRNPAGTILRWKPEELGPPTRRPKGA
jgi:hypothetical protein